MYVKNILKKNIPLTTFEGYSFQVPPGICWIWDKAGEEMLNKHKVESTGIDKYGFDNGHGTPALLRATEEEWIKEGKKLTQVSRWQINDKLIPRAKMITLAKQRGVSDEKVMEYLSDPNIDASVIAEAINNLPVPEEVSYPKEVVNV